jgi:hypothetical protein
MVAGRWCWTIAAIVVALRVIALDVAYTICNPPSGTVAATPLVLRWTPHVICPFNTVPVVEITTLVVAPEVTIIVAQIVGVTLGHITALWKIAAIAAIPIAFFVEAVVVAVVVAPIT